MRKRPYITYLIHIQPPHGPLQHYPKPLALCLIGCFLYLQLSKLCPPGVHFELIHHALLDLQFLLHLSIFLLQVADQTAFIGFLNEILLFLADDVWAGVGWVVFGHFHKVLDDLVSFYELFLQEFESDHDLTVLVLEGVGRYFALKSLVVKVFFIVDDALHSFGSCILAAGGV